MSLSVGGFFVLVLIVLFWRGGAGRVGLALAVLAGGVIAGVSDIAGMLTTVGAELAPVLNALGGGAVG